jgi:hypothetical protein
MRMNEHHYRPRPLGLLHCNKIVFAILLNKSYLLTWQ